MATLQEALDLALQHHRAGRLDEADALYRRILDAVPGHTDALHLLGLLRLSRGDAAGAADLIGQAVERSPAVGQLRFNLGNALSGAGRAEAAAEQYAAATRLLPDFAPAFAALGQVLAGLGRPAEALPAFARWAALDGGDPNLFVQAANLHLGLGRIDAAVTAYTRVVALAPATCGVLMTLARLLLQANRFAEATRLLRRAVRLDPGSAEAHDELGRVLEALRVWDEAADALSVAARLRAGDAPLRHRLGMAMRHANRDGAAAEAFRAIPAAADARGEAAYQLGLIERQDGRLDAAEAAFREALARYPQHAPAQFHLGLTLKLLGRDREAFADPSGFGEAHADLAARLVREDRLKDASAHFHEALLFRPDLESARRGLLDVLKERRRRCDPAVLSHKEHTDEWGNIELYAAMDAYNRALLAEPRLVGVPPSAAGAEPPRRPRVFDGFTFYNELDLLELRFEELYDHVDAFVVVEAPWTFQGKPKPLIFQDNAARFARFADKIVQVVAGDGSGPSPWDREKVQRDAIMQGLLGRAAPDDVVFIGDVDEIPRRRTVEAIRDNPVLATRLNRLSVDYYCGFLDFECNYKWHKPIALPYRLLEALGPDLTRFLAIAKYGTLLYDCGWHFSWLGGIEKVIGKLTSYAHSEYTRLADEDPRRLRAALRSGQGIFGLMDSAHGYGGEFQVVPLDGGFPDTVRADPERYRRLGWFYDCWTD
ncbi:tetratricopeptide repeat protein [Azospirillum sp.]|uniref:tetratricopeptide repeat protein n=1 Tax=Azospirillum sp. TaxID=34012 RepID=UPI003D718AEC